MKQHFIALEDLDLAYLVEGTSEFAAYVAAMLWAQPLQRATGRRSPLASQDRSTPVGRRRPALRRPVWSGGLG